MWRIGRLARMSGVSDRTLRHYDKIGLLRPAAVDTTTGYRWYGTAELTRLERIRGLQQLGLSLRQITDLVDAPATELRQALTDTVTALRRDIAAMSSVVAAAEHHLAVQPSVIPQETTVGPRRLRVRHLRINHPAELRAHCAAPATTLLTWLTGHPAGEFAAAVTDDHGERLTLPARTVVRAVVPATTSLVRAGQDLFGWLHRHTLTVAGPTVEDHLADADGARATILEIPVLATPAGCSSQDRSPKR
jgi:DNA-binding transcriptional MerR regulator